MTSRTVTAVLICIVVLLILVRVHTVAASGGGTDNGLFYYSSRLILSGRDPYSLASLVGESRKDGSPPGLEIAHSFSGFVNPPIMALVFAPVLLASPASGHIAIGFLNLFALIAIPLCLLSLDPAWRPQWRWAALAFAMLVPPVLLVLEYGQSTLVVVALLAGSLAALARKRDVAGGILLALSLSKFTLSAPFVLYLLFKRRWMAAGVTILVFLALNLALLLPIGLVHTVSHYRSVLQEENRPGTSYDPISVRQNRQYFPQYIVNLRRALFLVFGPHRLLIDRLNTVLTLAALVVLALFLRVSKAADDAIIDPLDLSLLATAALLFFYHRDYDLVLLLFTAFGLWDFRFRHPEQCGALWWLAAGVLLVLIPPIPKAYRMAEPLYYYTPLMLCALFALLLGLKWRSLSLPRSGMSANADDCSPAVKAS